MSEDTNRYGPSAAIGKMSAVIDCVRVSSDRVVLDVSRGAPVAETLAGIASALADITTAFETLQDYYFPARSVQVKPAKPKRSRRPERSERRNKGLKTMTDDDQAKLLLELATEHDAAAHDEKPGCPISNALRAGAVKLAAGDGPAQVATEEYRDHWTTIFGKKVAAAEA